MQQELFRNRCLKIILALLVVAATAGISSAATFYLKADVTSKTMPDTGEVVPLWGYAQCPDGTFIGCGAVTVPGPELTIPVGDTTLTINLKNNLPVPTSTVIPGLIAAMSPKWDDGATGGRTAGDYTARVMSFNTETAAGATGAYTWNNVPPGTRLYESGTNPAVQVAMGLYGAVTKDFAAGQAYSDASTQYNSQKVLLFSSVDPVFNTAVATGNYIGIPASVPPVPGTPVTSAIDYMPKYFLINGDAYSAALPNIQVTGPAVLLRFLNAGLQTYVPVIQGSYMSIVADDGNLLPYKKEQYSLILPAGKTMDAMLRPTAAGVYHLYDRRLNLTNAGLAPGGMLVDLQVSMPPTHLLTVNKIGTGQGTVTSSEVPTPGINCGLDCSEAYYEGTVVTLTGTAAPGSYFASWNVVPGGGCPGTGPCIATMNAPETVTATFTAYTNVTLFTPNGGEVIPSGSPYTIQWGAPASAVRFRLQYSLNNGGIWTTISSNITGASFNWTVPRPSNNSPNCRMRVTGYNSSGATVGTDASNAVFTIQVVKVTSPDGGETLTRGLIYPITWTTNGTVRPVASTRLQYSANGGATWITIATLSGNPGTYNWTAPAVTTAAAKVRVILRDSGTATIGSDDSNSVFTIQP